MEQRLKTFINGMRIIVSINTAIGSIALYILTLGHSDLVGIITVGTMITSILTTIFCCAMIDCEAKIYEDAVNDYYSTLYEFNEPTRELSIIDLDKIAEYKEDKR